MKELFAELKAIADLKVEIAKTETHVWQRLSSALSSAVRQSQWTLNETPSSPQVTIVQPAPPSRYMKAADAAKYLGISRTGLYQLRKDGILKYVRIGDRPRYKIEDLDAVASPAGKTNA